MKLGTCASATWNNKMSEIIQWYSEHMQHFPHENERNEDILRAGGILGGTGLKGRAMPWDHASVPGIPPSWCLLPWHCWHLRRCCPAPPACKPDLFDLLGSTKRQYLQEDQEVWQVTKPEGDEKVHIGTYSLAVLRGGKGWGVELGNLQVLEMGIFLKAVLNFFIIKVSPAN